MVEVNMFFKIFLVVMTLLNVKNTVSAQGINITGLERTWTPPKKLSFSSYKNQIKETSLLGFSNIRLPIDLDYFLNKAPYKKQKAFRKLINHIIHYTEKKNINLVLSNFNHGLEHANYKNKAPKIAQDWISLLNQLNINKKTENTIYLDIANEPSLYPKEWEETAIFIINTIREKYPNFTVIYGSSNYNSIYELSRIEPISFENIIYSFHFYEPFLFTHQGTEWTGDQFTTIGIPFPAPKDTSKMPPLTSLAKNTDAAINYRDYQHTGTYQAINDKLNIVNKWKNQHNVEVWCTEFGVTENADKQSRINYLKAITEILLNFKIKGFIWEYKGNFGSSKKTLQKIYK